MASYQFGSGSASYNMALDEAIAISVRKGSSAPVLRLYSWDRPSATLGCFQKISDIDTEYCRDASIPVVRTHRRKAILHNKELTYSFSVKLIMIYFRKASLTAIKNKRGFLSCPLKDRSFARIKINQGNSTLVTHHPSLKTAACFQSASYGG